MENFRKLYSSEDFVEEILSRLPPKSLMRFHSVCNLWCKLIKSPSFVAKHLSRSMRASCMSILFKRPVLEDKVNNTKHEKEVENDDYDLEILLSSLNLCDENDDDSFLSSAVVEDLNLWLPTPLKVQHSSDLTIEGHCNGIICLKLFIGNVILCNPSMKEFRLLPKSFLLLPEDTFNLWSLDYELQYYTEHLGFGYDPKGKDFKIVRFVIYDESCNWLRAEVYTMNSNSWREITTEHNIITSHVYCCHYMPLYCKGIYYLYVSGCYMACGEFIHGDFVISFDMGNELFHEILLPDLPEGRWVVKLASWKELISIFICHQRIGDHQSYELWVKMDDISDSKCSWRKHLTIGPVEGDVRPVQFWKSDQVLMVTEKEKEKDGHIVLYNIGTYKHRRIHSTRDVFNSEALLYVNSIVSVNGGNVLEDICLSAFYGSGKFYSTQRDVIDISALYGND